MSEFIVTAAAAPRIIKSRSPSRVLVAATALCLALSGCETVKSFKDKFRSDPPAAETTPTTTNVAPANSRKGAVIAAGVESLSESSVNDYMDEQEALLRQQLKGTGVTVSRSGDAIVLSMPGSIIFASNSADVSAKVRPVLNSLGLVFNEFDSTYVDIVGHTDSRGSKAYNQRLSEKRAQSVAEYLKKRRVIPERLVTSGMGEAQPIASNDTSDGRARNRRVEIRLTPVT